MSTPVTVHAHERGGRFRIEFHRRPGQPDSRVVLRSLGDVAVAIAIGLNGTPAPAQLPPAQAAELVMAAVQRHGIRHVWALAMEDRETNIAFLDGEATPAQLRRQRQLWGGQAGHDRCTDHAHGLILAAETARRAPVVPAARTEQVPVLAGVAR